MYIQGAGIVQVRGFINSYKTVGNADFKNHLAELHIVSHLTIVFLENGKAE